MYREYDDEGNWIMPSPYPEDYVDDEEYMEGLINHDDYLDLDDEH